MYGDTLIEKVKSMLTDVPMNQLEEGLLQKYLSDFTNIGPNISKFCKTLLKKNTGNTIASEQLSEVISLFDEHAFWSD